MIGRVVWLLAAGRVSEVVRQLAAEGAVNDRFLESADSLNILDRTTVSKPVARKFERRFSSWQLRAADCTQSILMTTTVALANISL
jgi:hypothetical protein